MALRRLNSNLSEGGASRDPDGLLSPFGYDDDAASLNSRSDQDTDSEDDELQSRARNSRELLAADRMVLMEEDDIDRLVTDTRRRQERQRRGSNLAVPNPLKMFGRRRSSVSSQHSVRSNEEAVATTVSEKRQLRRQRRKKKKARLLEDARDGEDGDLMYEMEAGGIKDGSSTAESSDRGDSDDMDRWQVNPMTKHRSQRWRRWRRWLFIHTLVVLGFAILVLLAWKMSKNRDSSIPSAQAYVSNGSALFAPTTIIISLDGFRADFLQRGLTPRLNALIKEGVSPKYMLPSFPSVTFPNHFTLATGLYPESHGIVGNTFWDPYEQAEFYYTDPARSMDPKWWNGEPFWVTAENSGIRTAVHMWPGSEAHIQHVEPSFIDKYNGKEPLDNKVSRILEFLDLPGKENELADPEHMRPQLIAAYVPNVDSDGHKHGPNSTEIRKTIQSVDNMLDKMFQGLEKRNLTDIVNVMVVSDHGMATTDVSRLIQFEDLVSPEKVAHTDGWPLYGLRFKNPDDIQHVYTDLRQKAMDGAHFDVYHRDTDMPARYHFANNDRIAPLWIVPQTGWAIVTKDEFDVQKALKDGSVYHPRGLHGYDHEHPLMRAIFVARGPAFPHPPNSQIDVFQNIEVYNMLCDSIGLEPKPNNGTLRLPLKPTGTHSEQNSIEIPSDPVTTTTTANIPSRPSAVSGQTVSASSAQPAVSSGSGQEEDHHDNPSTDEEDSKYGGQEGHDGPQNDDNDAEDSSGWTWWEWIKDKAGWVKDKSKGIWHKVTGGG